jgi:peptidoglycan/LPS O-acetylase OafA/YrhL
MRTDQQSRFDGIDVLRGLSIFAVILLHITIRMRIAGFRIDKTVPEWLAQLLFWNGNNGVTVFFAISGFLITTISLRRFGSLAAMRPAAFYRIRFARIAPMLLLTLAILSVLHLIGAKGFHIEPDRSTLPRALIAALTFHLNWLEAARGWLPPNWDVLWSLSIEEMFYLVFPLACVFLLRFRRGTAIFVALLIALIIVGPLQRAVWTANPIWREKAYLGGTDCIAFGVLCALVTDRISLARMRRWPAWPGIAGAAMMFLIALWPSWPWIKPLMRFIGATGIDTSILAFGSCLVMMTTILRGMKGDPISAPIRWLGRHSYEVYMTHEFIVVWGTQLYVVLYAKELHGPLALWFCMIAALAVVPGAFAARWVSEPLNRKLRGHTPAAVTSEPVLATGVR